MAAERRRGTGYDAAAVPLADGGTEYRAAEGTQAGVRAEHDILSFPAQKGPRGMFVHGASTTKKEPQTNIPHCYKAVRYTADSIYLFKLTSQPTLAYW